MLIPAENSLIHVIQEELQKFCRILNDPIGVNDSKEKTQDLPVVHPVIKLSEDHFRKNNAFSDGRYQVLEEQRRAYKDAQIILFNELVGLVFVMYVSPLSFNKLCM